MIDLLVSNWVCWAILILALFCYQLLWEQLLGLHWGDATGAAEHHLKHEFSGLLIGTLPLLGLLGTIIGLLECFAGLASGGGALLGGGIADALLTTQFGLLCAIPGWLMQGCIGARTLHLDPDVAARYSSCHRA